MKIAPFCIYSLGLASLFFSDILVTKIYSNHSITIWAEVRSLVGLSGIACLIGLDQVFIRSPQSSGLLLRLLIVQILLLSIPVGALTWWAGYIRNWFFASLLAIGSAGSLVLFHYYRAHHQLVKSQLSQQGWKILTFLTILFITFAQIDVALDKIVVGLLLLSVFSAGVSVLRYPPSLIHPQNPEHPSTLYAIGVRFMITSLLLAIAVYAEQLVVNRLGTPYQGARYFTHVTYFLFPISAINGYFAFLIGPWIRENHDRFITFLHRRSVLIFWGTIFYASLVHCIGWIGWLVVAPAVGKPDPILQTVLLITCITLTLYVIPSTYNGVFVRLTSMICLFWANSLL